MKSFTELLDFVRNESQLDRSFAKILTLEKSETLHQIGRRCDSLYLVESGFLRTLCVRDGEEITLGFFAEGDCIILIDSFYYNKPSGVEIRAIEQSKVWELSRHRLHEILENNNDISRLTFGRIHDLLADYAKNLESFITMNAKERYRQLLADSPQIVLRSPQKYIAEYLGITPVSLSRIKAEISR